ncbi:TIR domain-containing protein, partial [Thermodesulfobacteriota bacterium]
RRRDRKNSVIGSAVNLHDKLIMILSEESIHKVWTESDYDHAIEKELKGRETVFLPISLDDAVKYSELPWVVKMRRTRHAADFSMWEDSDFYQEIFSRLLEDLTSDQDAPLLQKIHEEKFEVEEELSDAAKDANARNLAQEFRAERRLFG